MTTLSILCIPPRQVQLLNRRARGRPCLFNSPSWQAGCALKYYRISPSHLFTLSYQKDKSLALPPSYLQVSLLVVVSLGSSHSPFTIVHLPRINLSLALANPSPIINYSLPPSYRKNINSTLGTHRAKCYVIVLCACRILQQLLRNINKLLTTDLLPTNV